MIKKHSFPFLVQKRYSYKNSKKDFKFCSKKGYAGKMKAFRDEFINNF